MFRIEKIVGILILAVLLTLPRTVSAQDSFQLPPDFWNINLAAGEEEDSDVQPDAASEKEEPDVQPDAVDEEEKPDLQLDTADEDEPEPQPEEADGGYVDYLRRRLKEMEVPKGIVSVTLPKRAGMILHNYANINITTWRDADGNPYALFGDENGYVIEKDPLGSEFSFQFDPVVKIQYHYLALAVGITDYLTAAVNFQFTRVDSSVNQLSFKSETFTEEEFWDTAELLYDRRPILDYHSDGYEFGDISLIGKFRYYRSDRIGLGGNIEVRLPTSEPMDPNYHAELTTGIGIPTGGRFEPGKWAINVGHDLDVFLPEPLDNFTFYNTVLYSFQIGGEFDSPDSTALLLFPVEKMWHGTETYPKDEDLGPTYEKAAGDSIYFHVGLATDIFPLVTPQVKFSFMFFRESEFKSNLPEFDDFMNEQSQNKYCLHLEPQISIALLQYKIPLSIGYTYSWPIFVRKFYEFPHHIVTTTLFYIF